MKPSILYLLTSLDTTGGTTSKIKSTLKYTKYKVYIGACYDPNDSELIKSWKQGNDIETISVPTRSILNIFISVKILNRLIKKENIRIIHVFFPSETFVAYFLKLLNPNLKIIRSFEGNVKRSFPIRIASKIILPRFDKIIYISHYVKDFYEDITKKCKNKVIIDNAGNHICEYKARKKGSICNIVSVAGLNEMKNVFMYAEIGKKLKEKGVKFSLKVVGNGPLYNKLKEKIMSYNIEDYVKLEGKQINPKPYYEEADIYIHPADKEGFGIVVPEAMSSGLPVIVSNKGGLPELVNNMEDGIIVDAYNPEEWADAIIDLYNDRGLYEKLSKNGYETYKARFTPEIYAKNLDMLYDELLTAK